VNAKQSPHDYYYYYYYYYYCGYWQSKQAWLVGWMVGWMVGWFF
jgi:hypothetical protein